MAAFGVNSPKMAGSLDKNQLKTLDNPGPGTYSIKAKERIKG